MPASTQSLLLQKLAPMLSAEPAVTRNARDPSRTTQEPRSFEQTLRRGLADEPEQQANAEPVRDAKLSRKRPAAESRRVESKGTKAQDRPSEAQEPRSGGPERESRTEESDPASAPAAEGDAQHRRDEEAEIDVVSDGGSKAEDSATASPAAASQGADSTDGADSTSTPKPTDATDGEHATPAASAQAAARLAAAGGSAGGSDGEADAADAEDSVETPASKPRTAMLRRLAAQAQVRSAGSASQMSAAQTPQGAAAPVEAEAHAVGPAADPSIAYSGSESASGENRPAARPEVQHSVPAAGKAEQVQNVESHSSVLPSARGESSFVSDSPRPAAKSPDSVFALERSSVGLGRAGGPSIGGPGRGVTTGAPEGADAPAAVARGLSAAVLQRGGSLSLKLTPESLGQVRIDMTMDKGSVAVRIEAGSVAAQDLLESSMAMLRSTLEGKGLSVDRISVHLAPGTAAAPAPSGAQNQHEAQQQQSGTSGNSNHQNAGEGASKGRDQRDPDQLWLFENQPDDAAEDRGTFRLKLSAVA